MRARTLRSSTIRRIVFDDEAGTLLVSFRSGLRYIYEGVPRAVYDALGKAASAGRYFNAAVKGRYACRPDPTQRRHRPAPRGRRPRPADSRQPGRRAKPGRRRGIHSRVGRQPSV